MFVIRVLKWAFITVSVLFVLCFSYLNYVILSFDTETLPENHGVVKTELFLGEGDRQPLIVGFGGGEGGNAWAGKYAAKHRDLLRENGYAFLAVAYFGTDGLPANLDRVAVDSVHKAIMEVSQHRQINRNCIVPMGVSRGSELALLLASRYEDYKGAIGIVPGSSVFASITDAMTTSGFSLNGEPLPFVPVPWSAAPALITGDLRAAFEKMMKNDEAMYAAAIPVENIKGPVLFVSAANDEQWPSMKMSESMMRRLKSAGFDYPHQHISLEGGHGEYHDNFDKIISFLNANFREKNNVDCGPQGADEPAPVGNPS
jgi:pimeloyl-ACP methyl ester carboxylesterase